MQLQRMNQLMTLLGAVLIVGATASALDGLARVRQADESSQQASVEQESDAAEGRVARRNKGRDRADSRERGGDKARGDKARGDKARGDKARGDKARKRVVAKRRALRTTWSQSKRTLAQRVAAVQSARARTTSTLRRKMRALHVLGRTAEIAQAERARESCAECRDGGRSRAKKSESASRRSKGRLVRSLRASRA